MSKIGAHVSAAKSLDNAPDNAKALGCEVFQFFSRSPRGGGAKPITEDTATKFKQKCNLYGMESYIHAPYYINFASNNNRISFGSVNVIQEELTRGTQLGVRYLMTHLGSSKDLGKETALKQTVERIKTIYEKNQNWTTQFLLEISAGAGGIVGSTFEELGAIIKGVGRKDLGVCLDTCHLFASGYDLRTPSAISETIKQFKKYLPVNLIKLTHCNDSLAGLGEHKDRHTDIGDGKLGFETFKNLLNNEVFKKINFVLETPGEEERQKKDIEKLKKFAS